MSADVSSFSSSRSNSSSFPIDTPSSPNNSNKAGSKQFAKRFPSILFDNKLNAYNITKVISNTNDYNTYVFYDNTPSTTDKLLYEISGAFHSTVTSPYNDQEMGLKITFWIEKYILIDFDNCDSLITQPSTASEFFTNIECPIISTGDITQDGITNILDLVFHW